MTLFLVVLLLWLIYMSEKPKTFKIASQQSQWQITMQEQYDALKTQGIRILVPPPDNRL